MAWLDDLKGKTVQQAGTPLPDRKILNFVSGASVSDNPGNGSTDVTLSIGAAVGTTIATGVMNVLGCSGVKVPNASTVTNFSNGVAGQFLAVYSVGACTVQNNSNILCDGGADLSLAAGDTALFYMFTLGVWRQVA